MTFDGLHQYAYDAWGRMTTGTRSRAGDWLRSAAQVPVPIALCGGRGTCPLGIDELVQVAVNTGV